MFEIKIKKLDEYRWMIPPVGGMRVPGIIYSSEEMMGGIGSDESPKQVANVAYLPGIVNYSLAMPDMHWGYGFPIGGVAAFDMKEGIISPGGVGYDINCGVRIMTTNLQFDEIKNQLHDLVSSLFRNIPAGVGSKGTLKLSISEEKKVLREGAKWAVNNGYGSSNDLLATNVCLNFKSKIYGNQTLFQRKGSLQDRRWIQKGRGIPVQNEKALFLQCHIVVLVVKTI